ncbi:MAG: sulfatase-like hydrolase/transferase [Chlamydiia bacterium]|nr:sulfatase-like hydrolase/transferase [Chlamydiia bacterium]
MIDEGVFLLFLLNVSVPIFVRFLIARPALSIHLVGGVGDLCVTLGLLITLSISAYVTALFALLIHVYYLLDACLQRQMGLRMRLCYCVLICHPSHWLSSARELGLYRFLGLGLFLLSVHLTALFFLYEQISFSWLYPIAMCCTWALGCSLSLLLPKTALYTLHNALFQEQWMWLYKAKRLLIVSKQERGSVPLQRIREKREERSSLAVRVNPGERPHVVFLFLESFGMNAIGGLGCGVRPTPCFDRLAQEGILFSHFYSNGTLTYRALLSGLFGTPAGSTASGLSPYVSASLRGVPEQLKEAGYITAFQQSGSLSFDRQSAFLQRHFDTLADRSDIEDSWQAGWGADDEYLVRYSAAWLARQKKPSFLTLFTITNHHPWILPKGYPAPSFGLPLFSSKERFLQTVHYTDFCLGLFVDLLRAKNLQRNTLLFVLGDHGQPMGEHRGNFYNSRFLYEENVRVPLLILADGRIEKPQVIEDACSQIDLLPTLLDLLHLRAVPCFGASLISKRQNRSVFLQNPYSEGFWGCRKGDWKWMGNCLSLEEELYNLKHDPEERMNLAAHHGEMAEALRSETASFIADVDAFYAMLQHKEGPAPDPIDLDLSQALISDEELQQKITPSVRRINLQDCLLLTNKGFSSVFSTCPLLEECNLAGITDLTEAPVTEPHHRLMRLNISDASQLSDVEIEKWVRLCPNLTSLSLNAENLTDRGIEAMSHHCRNLTRLKIFGGRQISDTALICLLQSNPHLGRVVLSGCVQITDCLLQHLREHPLEMLWLLNAPQITDTGLKYLAPLSIRSLVLKKN